MYISFRKDMLNAKMLNILMILLGTTGIGYYLYSYQNDILVFWQYKEDILNSAGNIVKYINYSKDIFVIIWCIFIIKNNINQLRKEIHLTLMIVLWGSILSLINNYSIITIIAGVRAYIYCFTIFIFMKTNCSKLNLRFWKSVLNTLKLLIMLQILSILIILCKSSIFFVPGQGGYRMIGLFTNAGTLGSFATGATIVISYSYLTKNIMKLKSFIFWTIMCFILAMSSGSRNAMLNSCMILIIGCISSIKIDEKGKNLIIIMLSIFIMPIILGLSIKYIDRGALMESGQGRFTPWIELFRVSSFIQVFFGQGLGVGTNAAFNLNQCKFVFDSTFVTIILQYGIIGLNIFLLYIYNFTYRILLKSKKNQMYIIYIILYSILGLFVGNIFEMYVWIIPLSLVIFDIVYKD